MTRARMRGREVKGREGKRRGKKKSGQWLSLLFWCRFDVSVFVAAGIVVDEWREEWDI